MEWWRILGFDIYTSRNTTFNLITRERKIIRPMITKIDQIGKTFLQNEEGCLLHAYKDRGGVWTIGYGNTYYLDGTPVKEGDVITQDIADSMFDQLVPKYYKTITSLNLQKQYQFNPLVSLVWNIGDSQKGFLGSSLRALIAKNPDNDSVIAVDDILESDIHRELTKDGHTSIHIITYDFLKWNKDGGTFDIDLYRRRWREAKMYLNQ